MTPPTNPAPPPVLAPPAPAANPWAMTQTKPDPDALHVEYDSTRAVGMRGELVALRTYPASIFFNIALFMVLWWSAFARMTNGAILATLMVTFAASLVFYVIVFAVLFLVRYPSAKTLRRLSYTLIPAGLYGRNPQGTTFKPWKALRGVKRVGSDYIFDYGVMATAYMPLEAFRDEASAERFMQTVRDLKAANGNFAAVSPAVRAEFPAPNSVAVQTSAFRG